VCVWGCIGCASHPAAQGEGCATAHAPCGARSCRVKLNARTTRRYPGPRHLRACPKPMLAHRLAPPSRPRRALSCCVSPAHRAWSLSCASRRRSRPSPRGGSLRGRRGVGSARPGLGVMRRWRRGWRRATPSPMMGRACGRQGASALNLMLTSVRGERISTQQAGA
jgi:hypothetical protein